jgi:hypothetical protein
MPNRSLISCASPPGRRPVLQSLQEPLPSDDGRRWRERRSEPIIDGGAHPPRILKDTHTRMRRHALAAYVNLEREGLR